MGLLIAGVLGVAGLFGPGTASIGIGALAIVVGAILAVTGLTETCLIYSVIDMDTR